MPVFLFCIDILDNARARVKTALFVGDMIVKIEISETSVDKLLKLQDIFSGVVYKINTYSTP